MWASMRMCTSPAPAGTVTSPRHREYAHVAAAAVRTASQRRIIVVHVDLRDLTVHGFDWHRHPARGPPPRDNIRLPAIVSMSPVITQLLKIQRPNSAPDRDGDRRCRAVRLTRSPRRG